MPLSVGAEIPLTDRPRLRNPDKRSITPWRTWTVLILNSDSHRSPQPDPLGGEGIAAERLAPLLERWKAVPGGLMPLLHDVQAEFGYVPPEAIPAIARAFNLSRAEVHGVVTFYHDFRLTPPARHRLQICQAESCQAMGSRALTAQVELLIGCRLGEERADGVWSVEPIYCLGLCAMSPSLMLNGEVHARVTPALVEQLIAEVEARS